MRTTDLDSVASRRAEIALEMVELVKVREKLDAEMAELAVTERVLLRLDELSHAEAPMPAYAAQTASDAPIHSRAMGMIRGLLAGRHA